VQKSVKHSTSQYLNVTAKRYAGTSSHVDRKRRQNLMQPCRLDCLDSMEEPLGTCDHDAQCRGLQHWKDECCSNFAT